MTHPTNDYPNDVDHHHGDFYPIPDRLYTVMSFVRSLPRIMYNIVLFKLPSHYFSQVARIFVDANYDLAELQRMALESLVRPARVLGHDGRIDLSTNYGEMQQSWDRCIDDLIKEWKALNVISVLLLR